MGGAGCDLTGRTEKETLQNELKWMADWALSLLRVAKAQHQMLQNIHAMHSICHGPELLDPLPKLDAIGAMASGGCTLGNQFDFGKYVKNDLATHESLERSFREMQAQASGDIPIPHKDYVTHMKPTKPVKESDKMKFQIAFKRMMDAYSQMDDLIKNHYTKVPSKDDLGGKGFVPNLQVKLRLLDEYGYDTDPVEFELAECAKTYNEAHAEKK